MQTAEQVRTEETSQTSQPVGSMLPRRPSRPVPRWRARHWTQLLLVGIVALLVAYYGSVAFLGVTDTGSGVAVDAENPPAGDDVVTLAVDVLDIDTAERSMEMLVQPRPSGRYANAAGEFEQAVTVTITSPGIPANTFRFEGNQVIDPVAASTDLSTGAFAYPFDSPAASFRVAVVDDATDASIPAAVEINSTPDDWNLSATTVSDAGFDLAATVDARRTSFVVLVVVFQVAALAVIMILSAVLLGAELLRRTFEFSSDLVFVGALLLFVPDVRQNLTGSPPLGAAIDIFVLFPSYVPAMIVLTSALAVAAIQAAGGKPIGVFD